jgi:hypothetical protein
VIRDGQGSYSLSVIELMLPKPMSVTRKVLVGPPHTYVVQADSAQHAVLFSADEAQRFLTLIEHLCSAFEVRVFSYRITPYRFRLIIRHVDKLNEPDHFIRKRWQSIGGSPLTPLPRIKQRFTSLGGFMQTVLQRFSRDRNRRHHQRGHLWAGRFRACLLADDLALLASIAWLEDLSHSEDPVVACSATIRDHQHVPLTLAPPPLRIGPDGSWFTADESPPGLTPIRDADVNSEFNSFAQDIPKADLQHYGTAISHGWAFGRPDSLSQTFARLSRASGRGRSRQIHDLDDKLGLCGVWG